MFDIYFPTHPVHKKGVRHDQWFHPSHDYTKQTLFPSKTHASADAHGIAMQVCDAMLMQDPRYLKDRYPHKNKLSKLKRQNNGWVRLQERGHEGTEANDATSGSLDVDGSTSGVSTVGAGASGISTSASSVGIAAAARCTAAGRISFSAGGGGNKSDSGAVVGADGDSAGGVDHGASASSSKSKSVDTRANGGDVSGYWLSGNSSGLAGYGSGLSSDGGISSGHASNDTERVGLGEVGGLGSRVDGR
jgi:hypothetical protein